MMMQSAPSQRILAWTLSLCDDTGDRPRNVRIRARLPLGAIALLTDAVRLTAASQARHARWKHAFTDLSVNMSVRARVCACVRACMHARDQHDSCSLASQCGGVVPRRSLSQVACVDGDDRSVGLRTWHQAAKQRAAVLAHLARSRDQAHGVARKRPREHDAALARAGAARTRAGGRASGAAPEVDAVVQRVVGQRQPRPQGAALCDL